MPSLKASGMIVPMPSFNSPISSGVTTITSIGKGIPIWCMRFRNSRGKTEKQVREEEPAVKKRKSAAESSSSHVSLSQSLCSRQIRREIVKFRRSNVKFSHEVVKISVEVVRFRRKPSSSLENRQNHVLGQQALPHARPIRGLRVDPKAWGVTTIGDVVGAEAHRCGGAQNPNFSIFL